MGHPASLPPHAPCVLAGSIACVLFCNYRILDIDTRCALDSGTGTQVCLLPIYIWATLPPSLPMHPVYWPAAALPESSASAFSRHLVRGAPRAARSPTLTYRGHNGPPHLKVPACVTCVRVTHILQFHLRKLEILSVFHTDVSIDKTMQINL